MTFRAIELLLLASAVRKEKQRGIDRLDAAKDFAKTRIMKWDPPRWQRQYVARAN